MSETVPFDSETFGGCGVQAKLEDLDGLEISQLQEARTGVEPVYEALQASA